MIRLEEEGAMVREDFLPPSCEGVELLTSAVAKITKKKQRKKLLDFSFVEKRQVAWCESNMSQQMPKEIALRSRWSSLLFVEGITACRHFVKNFRRKRCSSHTMKFVEDDIRLDSVN